MFQQLSPRPSLAYLQRERTTFSRGEAVSSGWHSRASTSFLLEGYCTIWGSLVKHGNLAPGTIRLGHTTKISEFTPGRALFITMYYEAKGLIIAFPTWEAHDHSAT